MRALVVGDSNSIWIKLFIQELLLPNGFDVSVQPDPQKANRFDAFYQENNVHYVGAYTLSPLVMKLPKLRISYRRSRRRAALLREQKFDYVFAIYITPEHIGLALDMAKHEENVYCLYIGSDLLRASDVLLEKLKQRLAAAPKMKHVCCNEKLREVFVAKVSPNGKSPDGVIDFGNSQIPVIDELFEAGIAAAKEQMGIPGSAITVTIGYNASDAQNHEKIMEALEGLPVELCEKLWLILPLTYAGRQEYVEKIENRLGQSGMNHLVLKNYMNSEEMARLWVASDLFIHAQPTDSLSASVLESIYAGANLFNGKWLAYPEFKRWNISTNEFETFEELQAMLKAVLSLPVSRDRKYRETILTHASWDACRSQWSKILYPNAK